ncbi:hypothetical protein [Janthinobacterium sp. SUN206]|uniref:hypothetical protein n=1 Tax=Janthinobacterium sp. SUN206 TaxID=3014787 RepID=UPI0027137386|nr:hypothetical protein [Janthinobacterium sp. SUN206]MDO8065562.1 hypothetical protein [Janthinobacterium sp. SUN206]
MENVPANIWYLPGPMFQYSEDVKALARQAGLKIIDANMVVGRANAAENVPEVTIKAEYIDQGAGERMPTMAELTAARADLLAAHDDLQQREYDLAAERERVVEQARENEAAAIRISEQAAANEAEAKRLRDEAARGGVAQVAGATPTPADKPVKAAKTT